MANGTRTPVRTKLGALFMLIGLITGTFSVFGPRAEAAPIDTGSDVGNFEIDALQSPDFIDRSGGKRFMNLGYFQHKRLRII